MTIMTTSSPIDLSQSAVPCLQTYSTHQAACINIIIVVILNVCSISITIDIMKKHHFHLLNRFLLPVHIDLMDPLEICSHCLVLHCQLDTPNQLLSWNSLTYLYEQS